VPHLASSPRCRPALLDPSLSFCIQGHQAVGMADASGDRHTTSRIVHRPGGLGMADAVHDPRAVAPSGICILPQQGSVRPRDIALPTAGERSDVLLRPVERVSTMGRRNRRGLGWQRHCGIFIVSVCGPDRGGLESDGCFSKCATLRGAC